MQINRQLYSIHGSIYGRALRSFVGLDECSFRSTEQKPPQAPHKRSQQPHEKSTSGGSALAAFALLPAGPRGNMVFSKRVTNAKSEKFSGLMHKRVTKEVRNRAG